MRLALALHRTVRELEETMGADEWSGWVAFHAACDFPDAYLTVGQLGSLISHALGGKGKPADFAPYYQAEKTDSGNLKAFFEFVRVHGGKPKTGN